jgi:hypothetical protein
VYIIPGDMNNPRLMSDGKKMECRRKKIYEESQGTSKEEG